MDGLSSPVTFGHTGFTGTSVVSTRCRDSFVILLTNRVHPTRDWGSNNPARRAVAATSRGPLAVRPPRAATAWFSGIGDARTATLHAARRRCGAGPLVVRPLVRHRGGSTSLTLEASTDGGATWRGAVHAPQRSGETVATDGTVSGFGGRRWHHANAALPTWASDRRRSAALALRRPTRSTRAAACTSTASGSTATGSRDRGSPPTGWTLSPN